MGTPRRAVGWVVLPAVVAMLAVACSSSKGSGATTSTSSTLVTTSSAGATTTSETGPGSVAKAPPSALNFEWPTYHRTNDRAGNTENTAPASGVSPAWQRDLDGKVYGQVLVVDGVAIAATENDTVYGLDARTGEVRWQQHVGQPVPQSKLPCGNIDPLGITGTPAYDPATKRVFVVAEELAGGKVRHELVGLDAATGKIGVRRLVDPPNQDPTPMQQRSALTVYQGHVYIPYGGLFGDCGNYHGAVVGVNTDGTGSLAVYRVPTPREGGIWAAAGAVVRPDGSLLVAIGNGESQTAYDGTDSVQVLRTPTLERADFFAPTSWMHDNANDLDLGSMSPALLPDGHIVIAGKGGTIFLLAPGKLKGIGSEAATAQGCKGFGGAAVAGNVVYLPCTSGVRAEQVSGSSLRTLWTVDGVYGSPVVGQGAVWIPDTGNGRLVVVDQQTGKELFAHDVGTMTRFASPTLSGALVLLPTEKGVTALSIHVEIG